MNKTFNRSARAGFTLVELIVVIAILAILAGIAIPVYTNYIKKAHQAADEQLLAAVNSGFAAACLEADGKDSRQHTAEASISLDGDGHVTAVSTNDAINTAFMTKYFKGNEDAKFQYYKSFGFNDADGVFYGIDPNGEGTPSKTMRTWTDAYGNTATYAQEDVDAYKASSFYNTDIADWAGTVDTLVSGVSANSASMESLKKDAGFASYLTSKGVDTDDDMAVARALVTYAANKLAGVDANAVAEVVRSGGTWNDQIASISSMMGGSTFANKAVAAAFLFGMSGGYANTDAGLNDSAAQALYSGGVSDLGSFTTYMNSLDQTKYQAYLQSDQLTQDIAGLVGVMGTVDGNYDLVMEYLNNNYGEFNNTDITDLVNAVLSGSGN